MGHPVRAWSAASWRWRASWSAASAERLSRQPRTGVRGRPLLSSATRLCPKQEAPIASGVGPPASSSTSRTAATRGSGSASPTYWRFAGFPSSVAEASKRPARTDDVPTSSARTCVTGRTLTRMAVVIASGLRKELSGDPLFDGVSFKVERRDRVALSGPNGAGKTTLLRALIGETSLQGGELAFQKGTRIALHDQRPPLERGLSLREYVLSG